MLLIKNLSVPHPPVAEGYTCILSCKELIAHGYIVVVIFLFFCYRFLRTPDRSVTENAIQFMMAALSLKLRIPPHPSQHYKRLRGGGGILTTVRNGDSDNDWQIFLHWSRIQNTVLCCEMHSTLEHAQNEIGKAEFCKAAAASGSCHSRLFFLQCGALCKREWMPLHHSLLVSSVALGRQNCVFKWSAQCFAFGCQKPRFFSPFGMCLVIACDYYRSKKKRGRVWRLNSRGQDVRGNEERGNVTEFWKYLPQ